MVVYSEENSVGNVVDNNTGCLSVFFALYNVNICSEFKCFC